MTGAWILAMAIALDQDPAGEPDSRPSGVLCADAWYAVSSGWIFITRGSQPGTATRAREGRDFDLDPAFLPAGDARLRLYDAGFLGFRIVQAEESGGRTAAENFIFHGQSYPAGRRIDADIGFLLMDLDFQFTMRASQELTITPHLGAEYWGFSSRLRTADALPPIDEKRSFSSGYWLGGIDVEERLSGILRLTLSLLGGADGADRFFIEAGAGARVQLLPPLSLTLGYRVHEVRFHTSTNEANVLFHGPSLGLELIF